jgi:hypothetical protein
MIIALLLVNAALYVITALLLVNTAAGEFFDVARVSTVLQGAQGVLASQVGSAETAAAIFATAAAVVLVVLAIGLWWLQRWAWVGTMLVVGFGLAYDLLLYWRGTPVYWSMALSMLTVLYLNQGAVQRAFGTRLHRLAVSPVGPVAGTVRLG